MSIDTEVKLNMIVDAIVGDVGDTFTYDGVNSKELEFEYESIITEELMKEYAAFLKESYPSNLDRGLWSPFRLTSDYGTKLSMRKIIDQEIDTGTWMGKDGPYFYSESERQVIMRRCAERIKQRLKKYAGRKIINYKIFSNGELGFRYE